MEEEIRQRGGSGQVRADDKRRDTRFWGKKKKIRCTCGDSEIHCLPISSVYRLIL